MSEALVPEIVESNYDKAINLAIETKADLPTIGKFMDLRERWEKNEARKAYNEAMTKFKANPPDIDKNRHVKFTTQKGVTEYNHADLFNVTDKISSELSKYGLSASWTTAQADKQISVTCRISHVKGHSESTTLSSSPDESGGKNSIQAIGSAVTYLQRYTLLALTGLATREQDNDGNTGEIKYISDKQKSTIVDLFNSLELNEVQKASFFKTAGIEKDDFDKIKETDYNGLMAKLRATQQAKVKK
ncbi:MAG: ERF family protein [Clostridia bacterium]|jgi:hypothetical protein